MNNYIAERYYVVMEIRKVGEPPFYDCSLSAVQATNPEFKTYQEAEEWIQQSGERHTDYTIMETFRKK